MSTVLTILVALITAIFGPLVLEWIKFKFWTHKPKDTLGESISSDEKIDKQIEIILEELHCDRVCIAQFHNGGHFYPTTKSIKKFSIFYERTTEYAPSIKDTFQNIPISLFPKVFSTLYKCGELTISDCSNNKHDYGIFQVNGKEYNTKSIYILAIKDLNGNFIGSLTLSFYQEKHELTLDEWIFMREKLGAIGTILTEYLYKK